MKRLFPTLLLSPALLLMLSLLNYAHAQSVGINTTPTVTAVLDVSSTTKGMLVPRMTTTQRNNIATANSVSVPATGLMVYDLTLNSFYYYDGTAWTVVGSSAGSGTSLQLLADRTGGTSENYSSTYAGSTSPITLKFENVTVVPTLGTYNSTTGVYTVGSSGAGSYLVQVKIHAVHNATPSNTVPIYLTLIKNSGVYGNVDDNLYYGDYPPISTVLPTNIKGQSSLTKIIKLAAGDTFKIVGVSANSGVGSAGIQTNAGSKITIEKLN